MTLCVASAFSPLAAISSADPMAPPGEMLIVSDESALLLTDARNLLLRLRLREAESVLYSLARRKDGLAAALYHLELASLLKVLVTDRQERYAEFYGRSDSLRAIVETMPYSKWRLFLDGESKLRRAVVRAKDGSYLRAAVAGRAAYRAYARLAEDHPEFHDARKGLGLLRIAVGSLPAFYRTFLGVLGIKGSVTAGLDDLTLAADSSRFGREESVIVLSLYEQVMGTDSGFSDELQSLYVKYPDSPLFAHLHGFTLYSDRRASDAEAVLRPVAQRYGDKDYFFVDYVDFFLADVLFRQDRFQESIRFYQRYLDNHRGPALKATASLRMGLALEMIGQRLAAVSFYADVTAAREFDSDRVASRAAAHLIESPMSDTERLLVRGRNAFDSGRMDAATDIFDGILNDPDVGAADAAEAAYRLGRAFHVRARREEALTAYRRAASIRTTTLTRWAPWAEYYAGRLYQEAGDVEAARAAFVRAKAYRGDFDYHQALEKNVRSALALLSGATS